MALRLALVALRLALVALRLALLAHWIVGMRRPVGLVIADRLPRPRIDAAQDLSHRNAIVDRAHADAKVTTDTLLVDNFESALAIHGMGNGLV